MFMKKKFLCFLLIIYIIFPFYSCSRERKRVEAEKIAREQFGVEEILSVGHCNNDTLLFYNYNLSDKYAFYIVGEKNEQDVFVVVPASCKNLPFLTEWPFAYSFKEIMFTLQDFAGYDVLSSVLKLNMGYEFAFIEPKEGEYFYEVHNLKDVVMDVKMGIFIEPYFIVQSNGELLFFIE